MYNFITLHLEFWCNTSWKCSRSNHKTCKIRKIVTYQLNKQNDSIFPFEWQEVLFFCNVYVNDTGHWSELIPFVAVGQ